MESPSRAEPLTPTLSRREREMIDLSLRERSIRSAAADRIG
jgi:hypothetical protein